MNDGSLNLSQLSEILRQGQVGEHVRVPNHLMRKLVEELLNAKKPPQEFPDVTDVRIDGLRQARDWSELHSNMMKSKRDAFYEGFVSGFVFVRDWARHTQSK